MGAEKIHQRRKGIGGIVFPDDLQSLPELIGIAPQQIGDDGIPEGVVHHAVKLMPQEIAPPLGVSHFGGGVLPDLSQKKAAGGCFVHGGADIGDEIVRQFIRYIQPPAGGSGPEPVAYHGIPVPDDEIPVAGIVFLNSGQGLDAPPGVVIRGPGVEAEPAEIGGILALGRAGGRIEAIGVEVAALGTGVVEHAVQNHPDAPAFSLPAQLTEIRLRAQHGVDGQIVGSVVAVVGGGFKNGIQIQHGDAEGG